MKSNEKFFATAHWLFHFGARSTIITEDIDLPIKPKSGMEANFMKKRILSTMLSSSEAAQHLGISPRSLSRLIALKQIEYVAVGKKHLFSKAVLDRWLSLKNHEEVIRVLEKDTAERKVKLEKLLELTEKLEKELAMFGITRSK